VPGAGVLADVRDRLLRHAVQEHPQLGGRFLVDAPLEFELEVGLNAFEVVL
jgi:hypothetical protein